MRDGTEFFISLLLAGLFLYAGVLKMLDMPSTLQSVQNFHLLPQWSSPFAATMLPAIEITLALALFVKMLRRSAAIWLIGLTILFSLAISLAGVRGIDLSCGCFGKSAESTSISWALLRNSAILIACGVLIHLRNSRETPRYF